MTITFSSCFYPLKSKFPSEQYVQWMNNFISIVNHFNLVIYTNEESIHLIDTKGNPRIIVIVKPKEHFFHYQYKDHWIKNHEKNDLLKGRITWEVNMLWSEKIWFVKETIDKRYFETELYGWCDIGYFRNNPRDIHTNDLQQWCRYVSFEKEKIYYAYVRNDSFWESLKEIVNNKTPEGLPVVPIPSDQESIAGGFFLLHKNKIDWWANEYNKKLVLYFQNDYLVKDDQMILVDCILSNEAEFTILNEKGNYYYDRWFLFQRFLLPKKISILMPLYNGIEFIEESVGSVINQTYSEWELLIGVNGHPANSEVYQIAKKYEDKCEKGKIRVYDLHNIKGKCKTLNALLSFCKNDWIALIDVDDIWMETKVEIQAPHLFLYDVVGTKTIYFGEREGTIPTIPDGDITENSFSYNPIINSSAIVRKHLCHWNLDYEGVEDYEMWLRIKKGGGRFFNCNEKCVKHRIHQESAFNTKNHDEK
jgi:teichuronic acid biosynthesis glycosyltransferase TuaG